MTDSNRNTINLPSNVDVWTRGWKSSLSLSCNQSLDKGVTWDGIDREGSGVSSMAESVTAHCMPQPLNCCPLSTTLLLNDRHYIHRLNLIFFCCVVKSRFFLTLEITETGLHAWCKKEIYEVNVVSKQQKLFSRKVLCLQIYANCTGSSSNELSDYNIHT